MNNEIEFICQKCGKNFYKSNEEKVIKCPFCHAKDTFMSVRLWKYYGSGKSKNYLW